MLHDDQELQRHIDAGDQLAEDEKWDEALRSYEKALAQSPLAKSVHERIVRMHIQKRDRKGYLEALARYRKMKEAFQATLAAPEAVKAEIADMPHEDAPKLFESALIPEDSRTKISEVQPTPAPEAVEIVPEKRESLPVAKDSAPPVSPVPAPEVVEIVPEKRESLPVAKDSAPPVSPTSVPEVVAAQEEALSAIEAGAAEDQAKQHESKGEKDLASKSYFLAGRLWEQKGQKEKAGLAYEKSYELSSSVEILAKLKELYGHGVKLKQLTVMEIYRRIYHMKV